MPTFQDVQDKIAALSDHDFSVGNASRSPATEAEIAEVEAVAGQRFPDELRELLRTWGVLIVEVKESVWPRPEAYEVLPAWRFGFGFKVLGVGAGLPPALRVTEALTPELRAMRALPLIQRHGARFTAVVTEGGMATWAPGDAAPEPLLFDPIEVILDEIAALEQGISRLRAARATVDELMDRGRAVGWRGPAVSDVVDALKLVASDALAPHVKELAGTLLEEGTHSMGCLDVIAASGPAGFRTVADEVYAHEGDRPYLIELLGKVGDVSPRALAIYAEGLESDDGDVFSNTVDAVRANAAGAQAMHEPAERRLEGDFDDEEQRYAVIGLLGHLGAESFEAALGGALGAVADDAAFSALLSGLGGLDLRASPLAPAMLDRARAMAPAAPATFNAIASLVGLGIEDPDAMAPTLLAMSKKGGNWAKRAAPLLARWGRDG